MLYYYYYFLYCSPLMPTEGAPAATAARAYSIWTSLPEGLRGWGKKVLHYDAVRLANI